MFRFGHKPYSDDELLRQYQQSGQLPWLGRLFERYTEMVYGVCLNYLKNTTEAEDAVMAIFETLVDKARHHQIERFRPWLYVLTKNHCLQFLRKQQKQFVNPIDPGRMYSEEAWHPFAEEYVEDPNVQRLEDCLDHLQEPQKSCIESFYLHGKSYQEIAREKTLPLGRVRSYIQNGRRNLRNCIEAKAKKEV